MATKDDAAGGRPLEAELRRQVAELEAQLSESRRASAALAESEERYRAIFEQAVDSVVLSDVATGELLDFNEQAHDNLGYTRAEFRKLRLFDLDAIESPEVVAQHCAKVVREGSDVFDTRQRTKSGEARDVQVRARHVTIRGRDCLLGVWRDVTEERRAQAALRESEERFRQLAEALTQSEEKFRDLAEGMPDGAVVLLDGRFHWVNAAFCEMYGYREEELLGQPVGMAIAPETRQLVLSRMADRLAGRAAPSRYHGIALHKDGSRFHVEVSAKKVTFGGRSGVQAVLRDITARKRAEDALLLSERQYRSTLDSMADAVHVVDRDLRILLANQTFKDWCRELGYPIEPEGRTIFEAFPFLSGSVGDEYRKVFETGETLVTEETTAVGGREIITETRKIPVFEGHSPVRIITVVRDITQRRKLEQEMLKTQKLESIGLLAGGIAHDFNNLLAGILANLAAARPKASGDSTLGRALAEAERAALRAKGLTQRLLTFSGGGEPIRQRLALGPLLGEAGELALAGSNIRCELQVPDGLWPVSADAQQISQVLQNLLLNARQAMPSGGKVRLGAENVLLGPGNPLRLPPGNFLRVTVADEGVGIAPENLSRVFDPFFTTKDGGSGLGLTASYAIVKKHQGGIEVQSQVGAGTTFRVYLPALDAPAPGEAATAPPPPPSHARGCRILLMDDDMILRRGARRLLHQYGYEVECARDGTQAIRLYTQAHRAGQPFDAVILDITVPEGMGGEECVRRLRELDPAVKAIACTGYAEDVLLADCRQLGFQAFIRKPFTPEELTETLRTLTRSAPA